ncbi:MAG: TldD/PmbA family protein [Deltaproteobacteria bacterium]|nr:TldD/PmbA family protein [Deltaproteobacteria bacterium]
MMDRDQAIEFLKKTGDLVKADGWCVSLGGSRSVRTRFANNGIRQSESGADEVLRVAAYDGKRSGETSTNDLSDSGAAAAVRTALDLMKAGAEDPEYVGPPPAAEVPAVEAAFESVEKFSADDGAAMAGAAIKAFRGAGVTGAGAVEAETSSKAMLSNLGFAAFHKGTLISFSASARSEKGGAGWAGRASNQAETVKAGALAATAAEKAVSSGAPKPLVPGDYTVVLEPQATAELLAFVLFMLDARSADEGRSFFSKKKGGNRAGEKIFAPGLTVNSDAQSVVFLGRPFDDEGVVQAKTPWIDKGVLSNLYYTRFWAKKSGRKPTARPENVLMKGGGALLEDIVKATDRGILVTRFWYTNITDPRTLSVTGVTRDGTFFISGGKLSNAVANMRFNVSIPEVLSQIDMMSGPQRVPAMGGTIACPSVRVKEFRFTSVSEAI